MVGLNREVAARLTFFRFIKLLDRLDLRQDTLVNTSFIYRYMVKHDNI